VTKPLVDKSAICRGSAFNYSKTAVCINLPLFFFDFNHVQCQFFLNSFTSRVKPNSMKKQTLKFDCLVTMAIFSKQVASGYLMNTTNFTLTGKFTEDDIDLALNKYNASVIETTDKVFTYQSF
jgi:hypothetical protein